MKVTKKDAKILALLEKDARMPYSTMAKQIQISPGSVKNRIEKLEKNGIIRDFFVLINTEKIGYSFFNVYLKTHFENMTAEDTCLKRVLAHPNVGWLALFSGYWSTKVAVMAKNKFHFDEICGEINDMLGRNTVDFKISQPLRAHICTNCVFENGLPQTNTFYELCSPSILDETDYAILKMLDSNPRINIANVSSVLSLPLSTVQKRFKKMKETGVFMGASISIDYTKLGYLWNYVAFRVRGSREEKTEFISYLKATPEVFYIIDTIGDYNVIAEIISKDSQKLKELLDTFRNKFSIVQSVENLIIVRELKHTYLPRDYEPEEPII